MYYTQEQIDRANQADLVSFLQSQGEQLTRAGNEYRWKRHDSLTVRGNKWYRHSQSKGGGPVDFVMEFFGKSFTEAVELLTGEKGAVPPPDRPCPASLSDFRLMRGQGSQVSLGSLESAVNLSEGDFSCSAQDIGAYSFFTNTTRIIIRTDSPLDETVTVRLWNTENMSENILLARLDKKQKICTFTHLSSRNRYAITVDNMPDISISVSSRLTFWEALSRALQNE